MWGVHFLINRKTDYAIRALLGLARRPAGVRVPAQHLSQEMYIPLPMLYNLVQALARAGLVRTSPGIRGGVELARQPEHITLWDVLVAVNGRLQVAECIERPTICPFAPRCPVRQRWMQLQRLIEDELRSVTIAQLAQQAPPGFWNAWTTPEASQTQTQPAQT